MVRTLVPPIPFAAPTSAPSGDPSDDARSRSPLSNSRSSAPVFLSPAGKPCVICFDMERDGVVCSGTENHFVCRGCLQGFIRNLEPITIRRSGGCVSCPAIEEATGHACDADPWSYDDLVNLLDPSTQRMYVQRLEGLLASVLSAETAITGKAPRSPYRGSIGGGRRSRSVSPLPLSSSDHDKIQGYRQYIAEEILTLKCPREGCRRAFLDFDGCFALTCGVCGCGFCAVCIEDYGDDAHEHCNVVHQGLFGSLDRFNEIQGHRRLVAATRYLTEVVCAHESRGWVEERLLGRGGALEKDLKEVGISVEEIKRVIAGGEVLPLGRGGDSDGDGTEKALAVRLGAADDGEQQEQQLEQEQLQGFAARQRLWLGQLFVERQGYAATDRDAVSRLLGTVVTASLIVAGMWRLTDVAERTSSTRNRSSSGSEVCGMESTWLFWGLVVGPAMLLLLTGRGKQLMQSLSVALLTALVVIPLFYFSEPLITFVVMILINVLSVTAHILGMLIDLCVEGARLSKIMLSNLSVEVAALYAMLGVKDTLSTVGLLPPNDLGLETAMS